MKVAVIGEGPSGLVTVKYLLKAHLSLDCDPFDARLFELHETIGGAFATRVYEDAELVSSEQFTTLFDFCCRQEKEFLSANDYLQYLKDYCSHFSLWPYIYLGVEVQSITSTSSKLYTISRSGKDGKVMTWDCDAVAVCSGLHREPNLPVIPGLHHIPQVIHSFEFKTKNQFGINKTVMVIGSGETSADIAHLTVNFPTKQVLVCHKDGFHFAPKRNPGPVLLPILGRKPDPNEPGIPIDISGLLRSARPVIIP
ncbi:dimethylaniline monooxygenase [Fusarium sporotrichioides]|uniref:Dimethylaniline monooxygenase n=1 Tax=Fusarium sporotrichioides TaxID=5514 RepID=A0A395SPA2_FUSSP|nr:dimethylaniline monooxygenase [Fusarium sporotrichioides]